MVNKRNRMFHRNGTRLFAGMMAAVCALFIASGAYAQAEGGMGKVPGAVVDAVAAGQPQDLIVLFDDAAIEAEAAEMRESIGAGHDTPEIVAVKASRYKALKQNVLDGLPYGEQEVLKDYSHLPMVFMKVNSLSAMQQLLDRPEVVRVYENGIKYPSLAQSLPLIKQPEVAALNIKGAGTAAAVLDTGLDYTRVAFGACSGTSTPADCCPGGDCLAAPPEAPAGCKVACVHDFAPSDGSLDDNGHGTNVSGIVAGVAPDTKVLGLDVFTGGSAWDSDIIAAINWCIAKKAVYNIVAINMSLGDSGRYTSPCSFDTFATPVSNARSAGILAAIASGNDAYDNGISSPACVPAAVSVGAVYDSNVGAKYWSVCQDLTTYADRVTCFSNSASFLTMLAPGSVITAAGISMSGTSQAAPHIAGSIAVLRGAGAFPSDTVDQTVQRMTSTGVSVTDPKNGITKPRIDLQAASAGGGVTFSISGNVATSGGSPIQGVTISGSGGCSGSTTTNSNGDYTLAGIPDGAACTITPSKSAYTFTPTSRTVTINGANITGQNFEGASVPITYSISGTVRTPSGMSQGSPISGVTITLSGALCSGSTSTGTSGTYLFTGIPDGATCTITPSKPGYTFTPTSRTVTINGANKTGQDFTGTYTGVTTYGISGRVTTSGGSPIQGVTISGSGGCSGFTTTNSNGDYTLAGIPDGSTCTVTPSKSAYTFTPTSRTVTINGANVTGQDFVGTPGAITYSISGNVKTPDKARPGSPISGVTMTLSGTGCSGSASTGSNGNYIFTGLSDGVTCTVTPSKTGYTFSPASRTVTINGADVTGQNFTGTPN